MISGGVVAKYSPPALLSLAVIDWKLSGAIAFGFAAGWVARAASQSAKETRAFILRDFFVSLGISGGALLGVLWMVRLFALDPLGAATAAFLIAWGGVKLLGSIANAASEAGLSWLRIKLTAKEADNGKD